MRLPGQLGFYLCALLRTAVHGDARKRRADNRDVGRIPDISGPR
jgi:hypothetical protein